MQKTAVWAGVAVVNLIVSSASAQVSSPQDVHRHDGFYFRLGLGPSYVALLGDGHGSETEGPGIGEMIAFGGTPAAGLVIGGSASFQAGSAKVMEASGVVSGLGTLATGTYGVLVDWFPDPSGGWHLASLLGLGFLALGEGRGYTAGASLLAGYDAWIGAQWSAGAEVVAMSSLSATLHDSSGATPDSAFVPLTLAIEATILCH